MITRSRGIVMGLILLGMVPGAALAQYPRAVPGQFEVRGFDFRPDGAWRVRTDRIRASRARALRAGAIGALNATGSGGVVSGIYHVPVVPIAFKNVPAPFPAPAYQDVLFNPAPTLRPYSVRTYYAEVSRGLVAIDGVVLNWVTADSTDVYYEDGCNGIGIRVPCPNGGRRLGELLIEGLTRSDTGQFDWGQYDNDGPDGLPNSGDDDGYVDFVTFLQPEVDGACTTVTTTNLWAHRYVLRVWNGGSPYVTHSPRRDATGQPIPGQFLKVDDYTMQSGVGGTTACDGTQIMPIGIVAHETGHAFGLPDLYDTSLQTEGIGEWGIMGSGSYARPYSPARFEAWSLAELGWVTVDTLGASGSVTLASVASGGTVLYVGVPNTDEYFLLENRQPEQSDTAMMDPGYKRPKSPGLLIWHIDQGQVSAHGFRGGDNRVNVGALFGVALVQADGLNQLSQPGLKNRGDTGDPYPGASGNRTFSPTSAPAALDNQGATAGFTIDSILQVAPGGAMSFRFIRGTAGQVSVTLSEATSEILGTPALGSAQRNYLDSLGNHNGAYDVGDYLAYVDANGAAAGAEVMARLLAPRAGAPTAAPRRANH